MSMISIATFWGLTPIRCAHASRLTARGVKDAAAALVVPDDAGGIYEVTVNLASAGVDLHVRFWPAGDLRIACESVILEESGRRDLP